MMPRAKWTRQAALSAALLAFLSVATLGAVADERPGSFGFSLTIDGDGFFLNPTLKTVTVTAVAASMPAAAAGIVPRDQIVEAEGRPIAGSKARELEPLLKKNVGEAVHLRLKRPSGEEYAVTLTAVPKAAAP